MTVNLGLINELGLSNINNITTNAKASKPVDKLVSEKTLFLKSQFNLEVTDTNKSFLIYAGVLKCIKILPKQSL